MTNTDPDYILRGLFTSEATPDNVRPYAVQTRRRAEWFRGEAKRLDEIASAMERWIALHEVKP